MPQSVLDTLKTYEPELIAIRQDIHRHPETCYEEVRTAALVAGKLREWGIEVHEGIAKTGVVGVLKGRRPGRRAIGLRADMDALNILEATGAPWSSTIPGKMHGCGHDGHTAMLLGAARYLAENPDFAGTVNFIFQPAEEGGGGGRMMVEEGLFERFPCDAVYGLHNDPARPAGVFSGRIGTMTAAAARWQVTFRGTGGHGGAAPHLATDCTLPMAAFITNMQSIVSRSMPPFETVVISVGHASTGQKDSPSVIPAEAVIYGVARTLKDALHDVIERRMRELATSLAAAHGCEAELAYRRTYPPVENAAEPFAVGVAAARAVAGADSFLEMERATTGAEDFSFLARERPGAFLRIGNGAPGEKGGHPVHTPLYDFNDKILTVGAAWWVEVVGQELQLGA
ncbi:amidohydrolase [Roseomonas chloroacetimidivorans]|uniref:amidohydrolase n=1 Tax=Roseomonas chloroacetimidivorans TaxID=1766656 RepID=UPI003C719305